MHVCVTKIKKSDRPEGLILKDAIITCILIAAVTLTSTLNAKRVVHPEEIVIFICITRGSPILEWFSEEYIGTGRDRLQILSESDRNTSSITPDAVATRINVTTDNGFIVIACI